MLILKWETGRSPDLHLTWHFVLSACSLLTFLSNWSSNNIKYTNFTCRFYVNKLSSSTCTHVLFVFGYLQFLNLGIPIVTNPRSVAKGNQWQQRVPLMPLLTLWCFLQQSTMVVYTPLPNLHNLFKSWFFFTTAF